jgi:23S rRNA (uridine2552-2'-O)-methyltransferase
LQEHFNDPFVKQSQIDGFRSRASYKLLELHERDQLFRKGDSVLDLGAAPGGWSQVAAQLVGEEGRVIASDILPMSALPGVTFIEGDFTEQAVYDEIVSALDGNPVDLVISDMAPNMSGMTSIDQPAGLALAELAFDMARTTLKPMGHLVIKLFHGAGTEALIKEARVAFKQVLMRKPQASRARSKEVYLVAKQLRDNP